MINVAVAGGGGPVGKTIVDVLVKFKKFNVTVLSRSTPKSKSSRNLSYLKVDYEDIDAMAKQLEDHKIDTVVATLSMDSDAVAQAQLNLIEAANKSSTTKRFVPSEYGLVNRPELVALDPSVQWWVSAASLLASPRINLQYTRIANGFFMDYWGMPYTTTNLPRLLWVVDMEKCRAAIPGTGNDKLSFTWSGDHAKFIARLLEADGAEWEEWGFLSGEDLTWNEFVEIAQEVRGKKFDLTYDDVDKINNGNITVFAPPGTEDGVDADQAIKEMWLLFHKYTINGEFLMPMERRLIDKFPDMLKLKNVKDYLQEVWKGR